MKKKISVLMAAFIISACGLLGTPPSDDEIKELFTKELAKVKKQMGGFGGGFIPQLESLVNHGCESHTKMDGAYTCDLEVTTQSKIRGKNTARKMMSFAKSKEGDWYAVEDK